MQVAQTLIQFDRTHILYLRIPDVHASIATMRITTIDDVFSIWETNAEMAREVGIPYQTLAKWVQRRRIPVESWHRVIHAAKSAGREVSYEALAKINTPRQSALSS